MVSAHPYWLRASSALPPPSFYLFFTFLIYFLIGGILLYSVVLVSAIQQHKTAYLYIHHLPSLPNITALGHPRAPGLISKVYKQLIHPPPPLLFKLQKLLAKGRFTISLSSVTGIHLPVFCSVAC